MFCYVHLIVSLSLSDTSVKQIGIPSSTTAVSTSATSQPVAEPAHVKRSPPAPKAGGEDKKKKEKPEKKGMNHLENNSLDSYDDLFIFFI